MTSYNNMKTIITQTLLLMAVATVGRAATPEGIPATAGEPCTFHEGVRYSELVINSRINDFYANTKTAGFGRYNDKGALIEQPRNATSVLDYVPGLVAKAILEAVDYYKDQPAVSVAPWFYAIQHYGCQFDIASAGKNGKSFDDLNAVKLYFMLDRLAASRRFADGDDFSNDATTAIAQKRLADALTGIAKANTTYVIKASTLPGAAGGWWHKASYVDQMWCDGQYMGPALLAQMINEYAGYKAITDDDWHLITRQFTIAWDYLWNPDTQLLYHAFTADPGSSAASKWAGVSAVKGAEVYHSAEYWGRAVGWYFLAMVDVLEQMGKAGLTATADYQTLRQRLQLLADGLAARQDAASGCWYQLLNHDGSYVAQTYNSSYRYTSQPVANYLESSCTALFIAAYLKGDRLKLFDKDYKPLARKAYKGFVNRFMVGDGKGGVHLIYCCKSAGLGGSNFRDGSAEYYLLGKDTKPTTTSGSDFYTEGKVFGGFIMAAIEYERLTDSETTAVRYTDKEQPATEAACYSLAGLPLQQRPQQGLYICSRRVTASR